MNSVWSVYIVAPHLNFARARYPTRKKPLSTAPGTPKTRLRGYRFGRFQAFSKRVEFPATSPASLRLGVNETSVADCGCRNPPRMTQRLMSQKAPDRTPRILRIVGWVIGLYGLSMLADDLVGGTADNNFFAVVFVIAGIATLVYARQREAASARLAEDPAAQSGESDSQAENPSLENPDLENPDS